MTFSKTFGSELFDRSYYAGAITPGEIHLLMLNKHANFLQYKDFQTGVNLLQNFLLKE